MCFKESAYRDFPMRILVKIECACRVCLRELILLT